MQNLIPTRPVVPAFAPVPRKYRYDGWTAERQRAFIDALAETGSVKAAAKRINMSAEGAYYLRRQPGADGFRAAWEAALDHGIQHLADIAIDRAREGVAVPIFWRGEQVGEKRRFNDRLLMFILQHHLPARYGARALPGGTKHPDTLAREAAENCPVCRARAAGEDAARTAQEDGFLGELLARYAAKVRAERRHRLSGEIVAADFTLRQLTHIELILDLGGVAMERIDQWTQRADEHGNVFGVELFASPMSERLDTLRRAVWADAGEPARPPLAFPETLPGSGSQNGPTAPERDKARRAAEASMAEAQRQWEAAATEEGWAEFKAGGSE